MDLNSPLGFQIPLKAKTTFVLFVCGEKLLFTSKTDIVKFQNPAIKALSQFYDIRVDVQEKAKQSTLKRDVKRGKNHKPQTQSLFGASVTSIQDCDHSLICVRLHL